MFGGAVGVTVHGMPQIGQLRKGLWVASGFGRHGLNTTAMAGQLIARSILWGDERWRLFSPFELVWAGGATGRVAGHVIGMWGRGSSAAAGALARYREGARARERVREARLAEANRQAGTRPPPRRPPPGRRPVRPQPAAAGRQAQDGGISRGGAPRRKVRKFGPDPCNFGAPCPVLDGEPLRPLRTEISMIDRRILLASVAGLFGLAAFRWLRTTPGASRREIRGRKDRRRMARAADAAAIRNPAQARHRTAGIEPAPEGKAQGHLRLRRLRPAAVLLGDQI